MPGKKCYRPCTGPPKTCTFKFRARVGWTTPDMADGREREFLSYNNKLPDPHLQVCEGDTVHVKLSNKIKVNHFFNCNLYIWSISTGCLIKIGKKYSPCFASKYDK